MDKLTNEIVKQGDMKSLYILARYMYAIGEQIIDDKVYDDLHQLMLVEGNLTDYTSRVYEEDPIPTFLANKYGLTVDFPQPSNKVSELDNIMSDEDSRSITPVETYEEAFNWFRAMKPHEVTLSLKVDGINTKNILANTRDNWRFLGSQTRGRGGTALDVSNSMRYPFMATRQGRSTESEYLVVRSESYVPSKHLDFLRTKYLKDYKIPRSAGMSVLRVPLQPEDMHLLSTLVFKVSEGDTLTESLAYATELGLNVVPHLAINTSEVPETLTEFRDWIDIYLGVFDNISKEADIPSDGVVAQLNSNKLFNLSDATAQYSKGNIALKIGQWSPNVYKSIVKEINTIPNKDKCSFTATVEPVITDSGLTVTSVNLFNIDIIISNNINIGSTISFEYKSENSVNLLYK